jgi:hypothetical protein
MALLECNISYAKNKATVSYTVVKVGGDDEIIFTSSDSKTGIQYQGRSPFTGSNGPQVDQVFHVGKKAGPFKVTVPSDGKPRHFICGEMIAVKKKGVGSYETTSHNNFTPWKGGGDTP